MIHPGDPLAWTFYSEDKKTAGIERRKNGTPRRIGIRVATFHDGERRRSTEPTLPTRALCSCSFLTNCLSLLHEQTRSLDARLRSPSLDKCSMSSCSSRSLANRRVARFLVCFSTALC